jgi:threonine dehydrogenase-like Zn-dependent dehydrogenase
MKAAVWYGGKDIRIEERPIPKIKDDEVLVKVKAVSICGSDLHAYLGVSKRRIPPLVMGHEFSGEVAGVGSKVKNLKEGNGRYVKGNCLRPNQNQARRTETATAGKERG